MPLNFSPALPHKLPSRPLFGDDFHEEILQQEADSFPTKGNRGSAISESWGEAFIPLVS